MANRCPKCNRSFDDDTLSFCLEDGTPLVRDSAGRADSQETLVSPSPSPSPQSSPTLISGSGPTREYGQLPGKATMAASQAYVPATPSYVPPVKERSKWPWILGILVVLLIAFGAIGLAAIFIPPMLRESRKDVRPEPTPRPAATPDWTATPNASPSEEADDPPDDDEEIETQLTKLEEEWTEANVKGNKQALERILAEEYSGGPTTHTKRAYIDGLTPDASIKSWELSNLTVEHNGARATVKGTLTNETDKGTDIYNFTDIFVWRDHRWQAVTSKTGRVK